MNTAPTRTEAFHLLRARLDAVRPRRRDLRAMLRTPRGDVVAGITVGVVALPLALAFGIASGLGATAGLVTAVVAGTVAALFGGSYVQVSGPTGAMTVVLVPIVAEHGAEGVAVVGLMAGVLLVAMGLAGAGRYVRFIPLPVIEGFTLGIAALIALQQVPAALGTTGKHEHVVVSAVGAVLDWFAAPDLAALALSAGVAVMILLGSRLRPAVPVALLAVVAATVVTRLADLPVATIGALPSHLFSPGVPSVGWNELRVLVAPAVAVAALAALESLLSATVADAMSVSTRHDPDRELFGQGLANLVSPLFGGMPATGAIARTAVNVRSGARTRAAAAAHAVVLLAVILAAAGPVAHIPLAALSGVLMVTAVRMVHVATARSILRSTRADAAAFLVTAVVTVSVDLIVAVGIGVVVAGAFALRGLARAAGVAREPVPGEPQAGDEQIAVVRIDGPLFFAAADRVLDEATGLDGVTVVVLRMSQLELVDATGAHVLSEIVQRLEARGVTVLIKGVRDGHVELFRTVGVLDALRHHKHLFDDLPAAVAHARDHVRRGDLRLADDARAA